MEHDASTQPTGGNTVAIVIGALVSLPALALAIGGLTLMIVLGVNERDGYITSPGTQLETSTHALVSKPFEIRGIDDWLTLGAPISVRMQVDTGEKPLVVGVAPADAVNELLDGVSHAVVTDLGSWQLRSAKLDTVKGDPLEGSPGTMLEWESQASGAGEIAATWVPRDGNWVIVAMNRDGSAGVQADVRFGAYVPWLYPIAWMLLVLGAALGALAAVLLVLGARRGARVSQSAGVHGALGDAAQLSLPGMSPQPSPVRVEAIVGDRPPGRWLWLVKWLLLIPHYFVLFVLFAGATICTIIAWFAIVVTGRYPRGLFDFNVGVLRWSWRVSGYGYGALATDQYPPFQLADDAQYPIRFDIVYPTRLSRGLVFVKWVLAFPHLLLFGAVGGSVVIGAAQQDTSGVVSVVGVLVLILGLGLLFTGRLPGGIFALLVGIQRWAYRTVAYVMLLTDEYPPFRLDQGGSEPVVDSPAPTPELIEPS